MLINNIINICWLVSHIYFVVFDAAQNNSNKNKTLQKETAAE
jgi:hypothetical protein